MTSYEEQFEAARLLYPGRKRGLATEFCDFRSSPKIKDWKNVLPLLVPAIERQIEEKLLLNASQEFCPKWPDFERWIKNRRWEDSTPKLDSIKHKKKSEKNEYWVQAKKDLETYREYIREYENNPEALKAIPRGALVLYNKEKEKGQKNA